MIAEHCSKFAKLKFHRFTRQNRDHNFKIGTNIWQMVPIETMPINRDRCGHTAKAQLLWLENRDKNKTELGKNRNQ